jgi:hypothetical protein
MCSPITADGIYKCVLAWAVTAKIVAEGFEVDCRMPCSGWE